MIDMTAEDRQPRFSQELPLTPMIDVVFLLVIFFLTIQFKRIAGILEARLPRTRGAVAYLDLAERLIDRHIRVKVRALPGWSPRTVVDPATGVRAVEGDVQRVLIELQYRDLSQDIDKPRVTNADLFDALAVALVRRKAALEAEGKDPVVVLDLADDLVFQNVVSTVNATKQASFENVSFTPPGPEEP
jgi:biopolymer transport protein ExbD